MAIIEYIHVNKLRPHPNNPRKDLGDLSELTESIKGNGILQNLTVVPICCVPELTGRKFGEQSDADRDLYVVLIGHRRLAAAKMAGEEEVPCSIADPISPREQQELMLIENMQRSDLTVYEQAQGFQLMLDMGAKPETIASRTGFSISTVRRRLKMAELDQNMLREVSDRQISLADFDELAKIEDIGTRNEVLASIGTNNFERDLRIAIREQEYNRNLPLMQQAIQQAGMKAVPENERYSVKWEQIRSINIPDWDSEEGLGVDSAVSHYYLTTYRTVEFYRPRPKAKPVKRPPEEIEREKLVQERNALLQEAAHRAWELRASFAAGLHITNQNRNTILHGSVLAACLAAVSCSISQIGSLCVALGVDAALSWETKKEALFRAAWDCESSDMPKVVYALFGDSEDISYYNKGGSQYLPTHKTNRQLDGIYHWLELLGYQMSDEEKALQDGTHELFQKEAKA